jgi:hypothetical protein
VTSGEPVEQKDFEILERLTEVTFFLTTMPESFIEAIFRPYARTRLEERVLYLNCIEV